MQENLSCYLVRTESIWNGRTNLTWTVLYKVYVISYINIHAFHFLSISLKHSCLYDVDVRRLHKMISKIKIRNSYRKESASGITHKVRMRNRSVFLHTSNSRVNRWIRPVIFTAAFEFINSDTTWLGLSPACMASNRYLALSEICNKMCMVQKCVV